MNNELLEFYSWRNGSSPRQFTRVGEMYIIPGFYILPLEEALGNHALFTNDTRWREGWLPILADGGGDFIVVDLSPGDPAVIRHFRIEETEHPIEYLSLRDMLLTVDEAYRSGTFFVDDEGYLETNPDEFALVAHDINPSVEWWK